MLEEKAKEPEPQPKNLTETKPEFKSSFKTWIRVVALIVVVVFLPEQVAQAVEYDWRVLWQRPLTNTFTPTYLNNTPQLDIPIAIRKILTDISNKPIDEIRISPNLSVKLEKPLNISKKRIEEIYEWLKGKPCGSKALFDFLSYQGIRVGEQDIAVLALTIDILNEVVKPEGNPEVIKNSLYALSKASEFFGVKLYPVKINLGQSPSGTVPTPFIAHLKGDHYILVTRITEEKVYYLDEHKEEFLPVEKFQDEFSGYGLVTIPGSIQLLSDIEAKKILGARSYNKYTRPPDYSQLFKQPSVKDQLLSLGISFASSFISAASFAKNGVSFGSALGKSFASFSKGIVYGEITKAVTTMAVRELHLSPGAGQIIGYATIGALSGFDSISNNKGLYRIGDNLNSFWNKHDIFRGVVMGSMKGAMQGGATLLAYNAFKNTGFFQKNPFVANQITNYIGDIASYGGFNLFTAATKMNVSFDNHQGPGEKPTGAQDITYMDGSRYWRTTYTGWSALRHAFTDPIFVRSTISQGIGLGIEYLAGKDHPHLSRLLGEPLGGITAGLVTKSGLKNIGQSIWQGVLSGVSSYALGKLGGKYDRFTGRNKWGLTRMEMAGIEFAGTALLAQLAGRSLKDSFSNFSVNLVTFGTTSPTFNQGAGGWSESQYIEKISQMSGIANFKYDADRSLRMLNKDLIAHGKEPLDWKSFVKSGRAENVLPSFGYSFVNYVTSSLHYGAVENLNTSVGTFGKRLLWDGLHFKRLFLKRIPEPSVSPSEATLRALDKLPLFSQSRMKLMMDLLKPDLSQFQDQENETSCRLPGLPGVPSLDTNNARSSRLPELPLGTPSLDDLPLSNSVRQNKFINELVIEPAYQAILTLDNLPLSSERQTKLMQQLVIEPAALAFVDFSKIDFRFTNGRVYRDVPTRLGKWFGMHMTYRQDIKWAPDRLLVELDVRRNLSPSIQGLDETERKPIKLKGKASFDIDYTDQIWRAVRDGESSVIVDLANIPKYTLPHIIRAFDTRVGVYRGNSRIGDVPFLLVINDQLQGIVRLNPGQTIWFSRPMEFSQGHRPGEHPAYHSARLVRSEDSEDLSRWGLQGIASFAISQDLQQANHLIPESAIAELLKRSYTEIKFRNISFGDSSDDWNGQGIIGDALHRVGFDDGSQTWIGKVVLEKRHVNQIRSIDVFALTTQAREIGLDGFYRGVYRTTQEWEINGMSFDQTQEAGIASNIPYTETRGFGYNYNNNKETRTLGEKQEIVSYSLNGELDGSYTKTSRILDILEQKTQYRGLGHNLISYDNLPITLISTYSRIPLQWQKVSDYENEDRIQQDSVVVFGNKEQFKNIERGLRSERFGIAELVNNVNNPAFQRAITLYAGSLGGRGSSADATVMQVMVKDAEGNYSEKLSPFYLNEQKAADTWRGTTYINSKGLNIVRDSEGGIESITPKIMRFSKAVKGDIENQIDYFKVDNSGMCQESFTIRTRSAYAIGGESPYKAVMLTQHSGVRGIAALEAQEIGTLNTVSGIFYSLTKANELSLENERLNDNEVLTGLTVDSNLATNFTGWAVHSDSPQLGQ